MSFPERFVCQGKFGGFANGFEALQKRKNIFRKVRVIMTDEQRALLARINGYAENVLGDIDPQKVPVSAQLEKLRPVMEEIAAEKQMSLEDLFILYMDLQSEASCATEQKLQDELQDLNTGDDMPLLFR